MKRTVIQYSVCLAAGAALMIGVQGIWSVVAPCHRHYNLLNPVKRCAGTVQQGEWDFEHLRDLLLAKKEEQKASGAVTHLSIYFQDLDHGPRFGIGEYDKFQPASLLKLPVAMYFLHAADFDPHVLDEKLSYSGETGLPDNLDASGATIQPDTLYTVRELLEKMIVHSDNRSYAVLLKQMNKQSEAGRTSTAYHMFRDLDVLQLMLKADTTYISISSYAKLFAVLYNSAYLSKGMSQYALQMLSDATFGQGIVAGVPEGRRVAHKFGFLVENDETQLHDCGIVYHPKMAYILCVMSTGGDPNKQSETIGEISHIVYDAVSGLDVDRT